MLSPPPNPLIALSPTLLICPPSGTQRFLLSTGHRTSKVTHIVPSPPDLAGVNGLILTKSGTSPEGSITLLDETGYTKKYLGVSRPYSFRPQFTTNVEGASEPVTIPLHQPGEAGNRQRQRKEEIILTHSSTFIFKPQFRANSL